MRILLINPASDFLTFRTHEVLGLGYLAAALGEASHEVDIYDCNFENPDAAAIAARVGSASYGLVGITTMIGKTAHACRVAEAVRRTSPAFIVLGGYTATYEYEHLLHCEPAIDAIVRGEGEQVLCELVATLERGDDWRSLGSLSYRCGEDVTGNPMRALDRDLDALPFPVRSPFLNRIGLASILSSRGCYAKCSFCNIQEFYNLSGYGGIRVRSPKNVVDEIEEVHRRLGIRRFLFIDDDMLGAERYAPRRNVTIAEELRRRQLDVEFEVAGRANDVIAYEGVLPVLKAAGLSRVYIGIESGSQAQLNRQRKGVRVADNLRAIEVLRTHGLGLDMGFIGFDPWSTPDEVIDNMRFLVNAGVMEARNLNTAAVTMILYPGTVLYQRAKAEGLFLEADAFTYAYRFKRAELAPLFSRIITTIKSKLVLESIDRYLALVKTDRMFVAELEELVDPASRLVFSLWARLFERWCRGEEDPALEAQIGAVEALLQNFCTSARYLVTLRAVAARAADVDPTYAATLRAYAESREEIGGALRSLLRGEGPPAVAECWRGGFEADRAYMTLVTRQHAASDSPLARRYVAEVNAPPRRLATAERTGRLELDGALQTAGLPKGARIYVGCHLFVPPEVFAEYLRLRITSQVEKFDTPIQVGLDGNAAAGAKLYRGWNEVELRFTPTVSLQTPRLVLLTSIPMERDVHVVGTWWRVRDDRW